ncbi:hypothetical protein [Thiothrix nivea]|uniref:HTH cro/C1-type domain-containing protein n=1 Tax=Thiothrix nivea (strain ATCC 35100 / DSM 5205 / JP2) TaxID=870187 RepID=A0A656HJ11_THINJ|nr:hypothetical protein [Thiothrix nivea]EIJ35380.1 hypothetical protein Thini_2847 [Thiothrix nivea DSM 5205]
MSAIELAKYVQARMEMLDLNVTNAARKSGISRQTWHKLMRADIKEAKLSTLMGVSRTLKTTVPHLVEVYFQPGGAASLFARHDQQAPQGSRPGL